MLAAFRYSPNNTGLPYDGFMRLTVPGTATDSVD